MDFGQLFADDELRQEFLDRFDEIAGAVDLAGGLEGLEGGLTLDRAATAVEQMTEGTWAGEDPGLEAIIERFARPVHLIQGGTYRSAADGFPQSEQVTTQLDQARSALEIAIPSVGRIDLRNHDQLQWAGTGWMAGPGLIVTNRHVAEVFAQQRDERFDFRVISGRKIHAALDFCQEYDRQEESRFEVTEIVWMEPDESPYDVAVLRVDGAGYDKQPSPPAIDLLAEGDEHAEVSQWVAAIGYPGFDSRGDPADRQRIFSGIYGCKRLAAGQVIAVEKIGIVAHDASTLRGSSGSALIDLSTGKSLALHFGGRSYDRNSAVSAQIVHRILVDHAG
jgi:endonuclease G